MSSSVGIEAGTGRYGSDNGFRVLYEFGMGTDGTATESVGERVEYSRGYGAGADTSVGVIAAEASDTKISGYASIYGPETGVEVVAGGAEVSSSGVPFGAAAEYEKSYGDRTGGAIVYGVGAGAGRAIIAGAGAGYGDKVGYDDGFGNLASTAGNADTRYGRGPEADTRVGDASGYDAGAGAGEEAASIAVVKTGAESGTIYGGSYIPGYGARPRSDGAVTAGVGAGTGTVVIADSGYKSVYDFKAASVAGYDAKASEAAVTITTYDTNGRAKAIYGRNYVPGVGTKSIANVIHSFIEKMIDFHKN